MNKISGVSDATIDKIAERYRDGGNDVLKVIKDVHNNFIDSIVDIHNDIHKETKETKKSK
jgi:hypothetical protein